MGTQDLLLRCLLFATLMTLNQSGLVKKVLQHQRQEMTVPSTQNVTQPSPEKSFIYSHVYNINVPASSFCSVDLDSPGLTELEPRDATVESQATDYAFNRQNEIVFTHRINIPKQACGCTDGHPELRELLNRLEMLEDEVSTLRERCGGHSTCCGAQVTGEVGTKPYCSGHGNYSTEICACICDKGWKGPNCTLSDCPNDCSNQGHCVDGKCKCFDGYSGKDCSMQICIVDCGSNGQCINGICVCAESFSGDDCSKTACLNNCLGRGHCVDGDCVCYDPWTGFDCSELICPNDCYDRGLCVNGTCLCDKGFRGEDCGERVCTKNCTGHGRCVDGKCICNPGYTGEDCATLTCPNNCNERGHCFNGICICNNGVGAEDCSLSCPNNCLHHGHCVGGQCICDEGFTGEDCSQLKCVNDCLGHGHCVDGHCICMEGYTGEDCSITTCPANCNNHGHCIKGVCLCDEDFGGNDCSERKCPKHCHGLGQCVDGQCVCNEGYIGEDCSEGMESYYFTNRKYVHKTRLFLYMYTISISPPKDLSISEITPKTVNLTWTNEMLVKEYLITYIPTSSDGLQLDVRVPGDLTTATITEIEPGIEYSIHVYAILDNKKSIPVGTRVATNLPQPEGLKFKSIGETSVEVFWEQLDIPLDGWVLTFRNTKEENGKIVNTLPPSQTHFEQSGLGPGQQYEVSVSIIKNNIKGIPLSRTIVTRIDAPDEVEVRDVTDTSAMVSWSRPVAEVDKFIVSYGPAKVSSAWHDMDVHATIMQHILEGLEPDTDYQVSISSKKGDIASEPIYESFTTGLDAPQDLQIVGQTDDSITVKWKNSRAFVDGYHVKYGPVTGDTLREDMVPKGLGDTTHATFTDLKPGTEYVIGVTAVKNEKESQPATASAVTGLDAPRDLEAIEVTETTMVLLWKKPRANITNYRLVFVFTDGQWEELSLPADATTYTQKHLVPGKHYNITLVAEHGQRKSAPATLTASTEQKKPLIESVTVSDVSWGSFNVSWSTEKGSAFENFVIEVAESEGGQKRQNFSLSGDSQSLRITGLSPNTSYTIALYGVYQGIHTVSAFASTEPDLSGLVVSNITSDRLSLSWRMGEKMYDNFIVEVRESALPSQAMGRSLPIGARSTVLSGLKGDTQYHIKLYATSGNHNSAPLTTVVTTGTTLHVSDITPFGFRVSWTAQSSEGFSHFQLKVSDFGQLLEPQEFLIPGNQNSLEIWGLITGIGYEINLTGVSQSGLQSRSVTTEAVTEAEPEIEHLFVSDVTPESFRLAWTAEDIFDRFVIKVRDSKKLIHPQEFNVPGDERTKVLTKLTGGTEYEIEIYGVTLEHRSQPLTAVARTGLGAPQGIHFSEVTDTSAIVHWNMPREMTDTFRITYVPLQGGDPAIVTEVDGSQSQTQLTNLIPGETYQVTAIAMKGLEESDPVSDILTTNVDMPQNLTAVSITDIEALLQWQPPVAKVDGYVITYLADTGKVLEPVMKWVSGNTVEFEINSLHPATQYTVSIYATTDSQKSAPANTNFTTDVDAPWDLVASNIQTDSAVLTWKPPRTPIESYVLSFESSDGIIRELILDPSATSHRLLKLNESTQYTVKLNAVFGPDSNLHQIGLLYKNPKDCSQTLLNGETTSGLYTIYPGGYDKLPVLVYCDMTTDGGGWLVILRRQNGNLDFYRNWKNYTSGFGDVNNEFWLGLSNLHTITASSQYELRVDLRDGQESAYAQYDRLYVGEPRSRYKLQTGAYSGTAGDSLIYHQNRPFSTYDNDNDLAITNCALSYKGAFWYKNCHHVNLMGRYGDNSHSKGINWFHWKGHEHSIPFVEMKIRPVNFRNLEDR
uniref:Tenascin C n=1 Tax=Electrophorus electricus TaxID=8005 RepID=A0A4W4FV14_ELEEL